MPTSEKDRLAAEAMDRWEDFQESLSSEKRRYPIQQFRAFWSAATRYAELTKSDSLIHKSLAAAVNGLVDFLGAERKRVPGDILQDAERLECLLLVDMTRTSRVTNLQDCDASQFWQSAKAIMQHARMWPHPSVYLSEKSLALIENASEQFLAPSAPCPEAFPIKANDFSDRWFFAVSLEARRGIRAMY